MTYLSQSYATIYDFKQFYQGSEWSELADIDNNTPGQDERRIGQALILAASEIDQIIGIRFILPITVKVPFLTWANIVIARKNLSSYDETDKIRADYDDVINRLQEIAKDRQPKRSFLIDESGSPVPEREIDTLDKSNYLVGKMYSGNLKATVPKFGN